MVKSHPARRLMAAMLLSLGITLCSGCVTRRYTVRTDPPGALVIVNDEALGPAPASRSFVYYGNRKITLILDGFETKTLIQPINAPWWDNYLTEFFTENIVPWVIDDEREFTYKLEPAQTPTVESVRGRAEGLRSEAQILPPPRRGGILGWLGF
jgi:PEGA domain-containing protein